MPVTVKFDPNTLSLQAQTIQDATEFSDGVMTAAQAAELAGLLPADVVLYVNNVSGSDSNPGTQAQPLATLAKALDLIKSREMACLIELAASVTNYLWPVGTFFPPTPVGDKASPLALNGALTAPLFSGMESVGGDTGVLTIAAPLMTPGTFRKKLALITSGTLEGTMVQITDNTATTVSLSSPLGPGLVANDTWDIVGAAVTVEWPDSAPINVMGGQLGFSKINHVATSFGTALTFVGCHATAHSCTFAGFIGNFDGIQFIDGAVFDTSPSIGALAWQNAGVLNPFAAPTSTSVGVDFSLFNYVSSNQHASVVGDAYFLFANFNSFVVFVDPNIIGADIEILASTSFLFAINSFIVKPVFDGDLFGNGYIMLIDQSSSLFQNGSPDRNMEMKNSSRSGLFVDRGAFAKPNLSGVNGFIGVEMSRMGRAVTGPSTITGPGVGNDVFFKGSSTTVAYGSPPFVDPVDLAQAVV